MNDPLTDIQPIRGKIFRSTIVRESLRHHRTACAGFALGLPMLDHKTPRFDFALVALTFQDRCGADFSKLAGLADFQDAANLTSRACGRAVLGLWAAWDSPWFDECDKTERDGFLVRQALALGLPFVITLATDGGEPMWPLHFWISDRYPHPPLYGMKYKGISVEGENDNSRRVKAEWKKQLGLHQLPVL